MREQIYLLSAAPCHSHLTGSQADSPRQDTTGGQSKQLTSRARACVEVAQTHGQIRQTPASSADRGPSQLTDATPIAKSGPALPALHFRKSR
jgi:hypothetical protein